MRANEVHLVLMPRFEAGAAGWRRVIAELEARSSSLGPGDVVRPAVGKPFLRAGQLEFNLSHSGPSALLAIAREPVGVDLELIDAGADLEGVVEQFFSPAERGSLPEGTGESRTDAIYRIWVRKEAYLKARGKDLGADLPRECSLRPEGWLILDCPLPLGVPHRAALATTLAAPEVLLFLA
jgi:hypothetical protein